MRTTSIVFMVLAIVFTVVGLFPCLGWINWIGIPCSATSAILGAVGMANKDTAETERGAYLAALICGLIFLFVGAARCFMGGGIV